MVRRDGRHRRVGAQIRNAIAIVVDVVECEREAALAISQVARSHALRQNQLIGHGEVGCVHFRELVVKSRRIHARSTHYPFGHAHDPATKGVKRFEHGLITALPEMQRAQFSLFLSEFAIGIGYDLPECRIVACGDGRSDPIGIAFIDEQDIRERGVLELRGVNAPGILEDVTLGPDEPFSAAAHIVDIEAFIEALWLLHDLCQVCRSEIVETDGVERVCALGRAQAGCDGVVVCPNKTAEGQVLRCRKPPIIAIGHFGEISQLGNGILGDRKALDRRIGRKSARSCTADASHCCDAANNARSDQ